MIVTHKISVDLAARGNMPRVDVVQDDKYSRNLEISLFCGGGVWQIPEDALPVVRYKKPDGTGGNYDVLPDGTEACTISGNVITVALAPQVCTAPGLVQLAVGLVKDQAEINTFTISIAVQENPGVEMLSDDYYRVVGLLSSGGWEPNMCLGTDENGDVATISDLTNVEYLTIVHPHNADHGFCMSAGETVMNEDESPAYAVAELFGHYGDEPVVLRGIADGVRDNDAVTVRQLRENAGGSGIDVVAAIDYSNQQDLTPTAIDPETGYITVAETVDSVYANGGYCNAYFRFKVWEPAFDKSKLPALIANNPQPYAIRKVDDHTIAIRADRSTDVAAYEIPDTLDLSLMTVVGTTSENIPAIEGLALRDFDLEVWGERIRPYICMYDASGNKISFSKTDKIDIYYDVVGSIMFNHLVLHRRGSVIRGTISKTDSSGAVTFVNVGVNLDADTVISKIEFLRRYSPGGAMGIRLYEVNGGDTDA